MGYMGFSKPTDPVGIVREVVIGSADIDARALAVSLAGTSAGPIKAIRVLSGTGVLRYVDDATGHAQVVGDQQALQPGDELDPVLIRSINGTSNASPSAALTLRVRW